MQIVDIADEPSARLQFRHETRYQYSGPVKFGPHRLVLRPREGHFDRLESLSVTTSPESDLHWYQDIFGNTIARAEFAEEAAELVITSEFVIRKMVPSHHRIETVPNPTDGHAIEPEPEPIDVPFPAWFPGIEEVASYLYRQSVFPPEVETIRHWVLGLDLLPNAGERAPIFHRLANAINEQIGYRRRESPGVQTPAETLRLGTGSCRDTAVLMMEAGRCLGFATRFVSGYLESENSAVGRGSTHAWTEVYLPDHGWVGYDPSIGKPVGLGHVAVGISHHPRGVMPISGKFESQGNRSTGLQVAIQSAKLA